MSAQTLPSSNPVATMTATFWPDSHFYLRWSSGCHDDFGNDLRGASIWETYSQYVQWMVSTSTYGGDSVMHLPNNLDV